MQYKVMKRREHGNTRMVCVRYIKFFFFVYVCVCMLFLLLAYPRLQRVTVTGKMSQLLVPMKGEGFRGGWGDVV